MTDIAMTADRLGRLEKELARLLKRTPNEAQPLLSLYAQTAGVHHRGPGTRELVDAVLMNYAGGYLNANPDESGGFVVKEPGSPTGQMYKYRTGHGLMSTRPGQVTLTAVQLRSLEQAIWDRLHAWQGQPQTLNMIARLVRDSHKTISADLISDRQVELILDNLASLNLGLQPAGAIKRYKAAESLIVYYVWMNLNVPASKKAADNMPVLQPTANETTRLYKIPIRRALRALGVDIDDQESVKARVGSVGEMTAFQDIEVVITRNNQARS